MIPVIDKRKTGVNLRRIMDRCGLSAKEVQEYLGLGCVQSVYRWLDGINLPSVDNLYAMSQLLNVSVDDILCGNRVSNSRKIKFGNDKFYTRLYVYWKYIEEYNVS